MFYSAVEEQREAGANKSTIAWKHTSTHFPSSFILWNCFDPLGRFLNYAEHSPFQRKYGNQMSFFKVFASAPGAGMGWGEPLTPSNSPSTPSIPPWHHQFPFPLLLPMDTMAPGRRQRLLLISFCCMQIILGIRCIIKGKNPTEWVLRCWGGFPCRTAEEEAPVRGCYQIIPFFRSPSTLSQDAHSSRSEQKYVQIHRNPSYGFRRGVVTWEGMSLSLLQDELILGHGAEEHKGQGDLRSRVGWSRDQLLGKGGTAWAHLSRCRWSRAWGSLGLCRVGMCFGASRKGECKILLFLHFKAFETLLSEGPGAAK